jgi:hypothetical protein
MYYTDEFEKNALVVRLVTAKVRDEWTDWPINQFEAFGIVSYHSAGLYSTLSEFYGKKVSLRDVVIDTVLIISYVYFFLENFSIWAHKHRMVALSPILRFDEITAMAKKEVNRATTLFPDWPENQFEALSILSEEIGEVHKALIDLKHKSGPVEDVITETVQSIAMGYRFLFGLAGRGCDD